MQPNPADKLNKALLEAGRYYRGVVAGALSRTLHFFGWREDRKRLLLLLVFLAGPLLQWKIQGFAAMTEELQMLAMYAFAPGIIMLIANLFMEPVRQDRLLRPTEKPVGLYLVDDSPQGWVTSFPQRESKRFAHREWHVSVQNIVGVGGVFRAQMAPSHGYGLVWDPPWLESAGPEYRIEPIGRGRLLIFGDIVDEFDRLVVRPVRHNPETGQMELLTSDDLEADHYGEKTEFTLHMWSDPPGPHPIEKKFRVGKRGVGVQWKDGDRWVP